MVMKKLSYFLFLIIGLGGSSWGSSDTSPSSPDSGGPTGTLETMIVARGDITIDLDLQKLQASNSEAYELKRETVHFEVDPDSFFVLRAFNNALRGPRPGILRLIKKNGEKLPAALASVVNSNRLVLEKLHPGGRFDLVIRDGDGALALFNVEGHLYEYDATKRLLEINGGRLLISEEFANRLGRPALSGELVGEISIAATTAPIEITKIVDGESKSSTLPPRRRGGTPGRQTIVPGPDIIVGDMSELGQYGAAGTQVGLGIGTDSCNNGDQEVHFHELPDPDHPFVSQNLYRMSGGSNNSERLEQIGQAWVKHTFGADQFDDCEFGCIPAVGFITLGVGCSDAYLSSQNASQTNHSGALGSRAWINPYTGAFSVNPRPDNHTGHIHTGTSHRILVESNDLNPAMNPGATYYAEVQYDSPHEYAWCQSHPGECNMFNNASYRRYNVTMTTSFSFAPVGGTQSMSPATDVWPGAATVRIEPEPGVDGRAFVVYKVTNPSAGVWHYEYAIHNTNLDRSIQSFAVPLGAGVTVSNVGFHAPPNHPGFPNDGTLNNTGFSNAPWTPAQTSSEINWSTETFAQNQNANAIRFATMYNFRFDSNRPPQPVMATIGFFKNGSPITVEIMAPISDSASPTPTPAPLAQAVNLSTRMKVQTGEGVGIGGFIVSGNAPKRVLIRAIGPSLTAAGLPGVLADPALELHGPAPFVTINNNNWRDSQEAAIQATGIPPLDNLESAILATLDPGSYTAIVSGNGGSTGVALVEIYDLDPTVGKLVNISTRASVGRGDEVVIAGFILGSTGNGDTVVVRGLGPSLAASGVQNALANPALELRDGNGVVMISDNDWIDNPAQAADVSEAGLALTETAEAAISAVLQPGLYTAVLNGHFNTTGVGVVEIYDRGTP
jgi:hypothetical protein